MLKIILKDIKTFFKDKTVLFWALVFPVFLTLLLGNALMSVFPTTDNINNFFSDINIEYVSNGDRVLTESFEEFLSTIEKEMDISYTKSENIESSIEKIKNQEISIAVEIDSNNLFNITKSRQSKSELAENLIKVFVEKFNVVQTVSIKGNQAFIEEVLQELYNSKSYIEVTSLNRETRDTSAMDYFGIVNVFALVFWMVPTILPLFSAEVKEGLLGRIRISGISKTKYLIIKFISLSILLSIVALNMLIFNILVFDVFVGNSLVHMILLLLSTVILVCAIGAFIIAKFSKLDEGIGLIDSLVPVVMFLGGGILPILDFTGDAGLNAIGKYTPLFVQNKAAFGLINGGNYDVITEAFKYNFSLAIVLMILAAIIFNRKE